VGPAQATVDAGWGFVVADAVLGAVQKLDGVGGKGVRLDHLADAVQLRVEADCGVRPTLTHVAVAVDRMLSEQVLYEPVICHYRELRVEADWPIRNLQVHPRHSAPNPLDVGAHVSQ
jgi:hypothetical protein